jgi:nucleoid-associated protein YgaU
MVHRVRTGDTLAAIANRYYGSGSSYRVIVEANRDTLSSPDAIKPGQVLYLPLEPLKGRPARQRPDAYVVAQGDTLEVVARKVLGNGEKGPAILAANRVALPNAQSLAPGLILEIPR